MNALKRIGIDTYMLLLLGTVALGLLLPLSGVAAKALQLATWWAVVLPWQACRPWTGAPQAHRWKTRA